MHWLFSFSIQNYHKKEKRTSHLIGNFVKNWTEKISQESQCTEGPRLKSEREVSDYISILSWTVSSKTNDDCSE